MSDLVLLNALLEILVTLGVHVVRPDQDTPFTGRDGKRSNSSHDVAYYLARGEHVDEPPVFRLELAVPVDLCVVKLKDAVVLRRLDLEVVRAGQDFILESPELGLGPDIVDLVDDGLDGAVLVDEDLGYELFVGKISLAEIEMRLEILVGLLG
jgi:hypothetical protein